MSGVGEVVGLGIYLVGGKKALGGKLEGRHLMWRLFVCGT